MGFAVFEQDADRGQSFYLFNGASSRTRYEVALHEAYVGWFWRRVDLRLIAAFEPLIGMLMIGWSGSYTYLAVQRYWQSTDRRP